MIPLEKAATQTEAAEFVVANATHFSALNPGALGTINQLYGSSPVSASGLTWRWQYLVGKGVRHQLQFDAVADNDASQSLNIELFQDLTLPEPPQLLWQHFKGAMRCAAWTVVHEPFIDLLCTVCGVDWNLHSVDTPVSPGSPPGQETAGQETAVGFSVSSDDNPAILVRGIARLPHALSQAILARSTPGLANPTWRDGHAYAECVIDTVTIDASELAELKRDSIVLIDNRTLASMQPRLFLTVGEQRWLAEIDDTKLTILARSDRALDTPLPSCEDTRMKVQTDNENQVMPPDTATVSIASAEDDAPVDVASVPITLRFEAGRLALPLERLQSIHPGFVFELDQPLDQQTIKIFANDKAVASGELVLVGDRVGVRLTNSLTPVKV